MQIVSILGIRTNCKQRFGGWGLEAEAGEVDAEGVVQIRKRIRVRLLRKGVYQQEGPLQLWLRYNNNKKNEEVLFFKYLKKNGKVSKDCGGGSNKSKLNHRGKWETFTRSKQTNVITIKSTHTGASFNLSTPCVT